MRSIIISLIVAFGAVSFFATSSHAGNSYSGGYGGYAYEADYHGGYAKKRHYRPHCWYKKIRVYDDYGYLVVRRVKVCN